MPHPPNRSIPAPGRRCWRPAHAALPVGARPSGAAGAVIDAQRPGHVLTAMGALTHGNVRVSLPRGTTQIPVAEFLAVLPGIVAGLRDMVGPPPEGPALKG
jgi:cysteine desulfurase